MPALETFLRSPEFGDTDNTRVSRVARAVGNTTKVLHRNTPVSRYKTITSRGNKCLEVDLLDFFADALGQEVTMYGDNFIIHEMPTIHEDTAGYTVILILEVIC